MFAIDAWANFFMNEKLEPKRVGDEDGMVLVELCEALAMIRSPKHGRSHKDKLAARKLAVGIAMDLGIDLTAMKCHGKMAMGRGLLDAWNKEYQARYGSLIGTASNMEAKRRDVKTRLCKEGIKGVPRA